MTQNLKAPKLRFPGFTDDWEQRKLGDVSYSFEYGLNAAAKEFDGENKYIRITDIDDDGREFKQSQVTSPDTDLASADNYKLSYGDILFARTGASVGKTYIYKDSDGLVYYAGFLIRARIKEEYNPEFVFQNTLTKDYEKFIKVTSMRSGQPGVNAQEYSEYQIMVPSKHEQDKISKYFSNLDNLITLHQRKFETLKKLKKGFLQKMFPKNGESVPEIRFPGFTDAWEQRKFSELYAKVTEKNDLSFGADKIISVANMYFKEDTKESSDDYMKTYNVMRLGDIAFEGNRNKNYAHGRFVENTIGDGIVSHVFDVFRPIVDYDLNYWKYYINNEIVMGRTMARCTKSSTMMTNLVANDFLKEAVLVPVLEEQKKIGQYFSNLDNLITLHQRKLDTLKKLKQGMLQQMFI